MRAETRQAAADLLNANGILTEIGNAPDGGGWQGAPGIDPFTPYCMVFMGGSKDIRHRDLDGNFDEATPTLSLRVVGGTATQADETLDAVDDVMKSRTLTVPGFTMVHLIFDSSITTTKDDDVEPPQYFNASFWRIWMQETP